MRSKGAFTLIELLIVIAVIGLLLAILLPALRKVKEESYEVKCMTNLKSIGAACLMYSDDNRGVLPATCPGMITWLPPDTRDHFDEYLNRDGQCFYCPTLRKNVNKYEPTFCAPGTIRDKWAHTELEIGKAENPTDFHYICYIYVGNPTYAGNPDDYWIDSNKNGLLSDEYIINLQKDRRVSANIIVCDIQPNIWHPLAGTYRHPTDSKKDLGTGNQLYGDLHIENRKAKDMKLRWYPPNPVRW